MFHINNVTMPSVWSGHHVHVHAGTRNRDQPVCLVDGLGGMVDVGAQFFGDVIWRCRGVGHVGGGANRRAAT